MPEGGGGGQCGGARQAPWSCCTGGREKGKAGEPPKAQKPRGPCAVSPCGGGQPALAPSLPVPLGPLRVLVVADEPAESGCCCCSVSRVAGFATLRAVYIHTRVPCVMMMARSLPSCLLCVQVVCSLGHACNARWYDLILQLLGTLLGVIIVGCINLPAGPSEADRRRRLFRIVSILEKRRKRTRLLPQATCSKNPPKIILRCKSLQKWAND